AAAPPRPLSDAAARPPSREPARRSAVARTGARPDRGRMRILVLLLLVACAHPERRLTTFKAEIMSADYRADLPALARFPDELQPLADNPDIGYLACYWSAYSRWRLAMNGASHGMAAADLETQLERAVVELEAANAKNPSFADGYAAEASILSWLAAIHRADRPAMLERLNRGKQLLARAKELAPENPRVLWVIGGGLLFAPPEYGGNIDKAIEVYRHMAEVAGPPQPDAALPDWG